MKLSGHWLHYSSENSPLPGPLVWPVAFDSGNRAWMWISGKSQESLGIVVFDGRDWTRYPQGYAGLPDNPIMEMVVDSNDRVWLHSPFVGAYRFDGEQVITYKPRFVGLPPLICAANLTGTDGHGNIWFAWPSVGVHCFDDSAWKIFTSANSGLTSDWVMALSVDFRGRLWFGVQRPDQADLICFDGSNWKIRASLPVNRLKYQITALAVDQNEHIWLGWCETWLWRFDGSRWRRYTDRNSPLPSSTVYSLLVDSANRIWIGTPGGIVINEKDEWACWGAIIPDTAQKPLSREAVPSSGTLADQPYVLIGSFVAEDRQGRKWITSVDGICVFVPS